MYTLQRMSTAGAALQRSINVLSGERAARLGTTVAGLRAKVPPVTRLRSAPLKGSLLHLPPCDAVLKPAISHTFQTFSGSGRLISPNFSCPRKWSPPAVLCACGAKVLGGGVLVNHPPRGAPQWLRRRSPPAARTLTRVCTLASCTRFALHPPPLPAAA